MRLPARRHTFTAALFFAFVPLAQSRLTRAADPPPEASPSSSSTPPAAPTAPPPSASAAPTAAPTAAAASTSTAAPAAFSIPLLGPIERLGPDAFPNTPIRGIAGGSLWSIFHGLQWPYYPKTGIGVSGYVWIDTGYEHIHRGDPGQVDTSFQVQQGRFVLRATPTWSDGRWFVQGDAELVANKDQTNSPSSNGQPDADDVWVKVGRWKSFDVQLGRYEAWEVYHFGMGLDLYTLERQGATDLGTGNTNLSIYGLTYAFYRAGNFGEGAVHIYPTDWLRFELGTQYGNEAGTNGEAIRPVAIADFGWLKLKGGVEWKQHTPEQDGLKAKITDQGAGGALQVVIDPYVEFGVNYAFGKEDNIAQDGNRSPGSYKTYSVGGFANGRIADGLLLGAGVNYTYLVNEQFDPKINRNEDFDHWQAFGAIQYHLFKQLFIKLVGGYALANFNPVTTDANPIVHTDTMVSGRLRVQYLF